MSYWLLKTEPDDYAWADLVRENEAVWDGVKAPAAVKNVKQMQPGDLAFIYHTGQERSIVGIAKVTTHPCRNPDGQEWVVKIAPLEKLDKAVSLKEIKADGRFADWDLVRLPRLSVVPVSREQWESIVGWSEQAHG